MKRHRHAISQTNVTRIAGFWLLLLASTCAAQTPIYISGKVLDGPGGNLLADVAVSLRQGDLRQPLTVVQSLGNGSFVLKVPAPGSYRIIAIGPGRRSVIRPVDVPAKGLDGITLELGSTVILPNERTVVARARLANIRIHVVDTAGTPVRRGTLQAWVVWSPLPPANAAAQNEDRAVDAFGGRALQLARRGEGACGVWSGIVGAATDFMDVEGPPFPVPVVPCRVGIAVRSPLFGSGRLMLDAWPDKMVTVKLVRSGNLHVNVTNAAGDPVPGAHVSVAGMDVDPCVRFLQGWALGMTGETGEVDIPSVTEGRSIVRLSPANGYGTTGDGLHIVEVGATKVDLDIPFPDRLALPPQSAAIHWLGYRLARREYMYGFGYDRPEANGGRERTAISNRIVDLPPSRMDAQHPIPPIHVSGKLVRDAGGPLPRVLIDVLEPGWDYPLDAAITREDGSFDLSVLAPGAYTLKIDQSQNLPGTRPLVVPAGGVMNLRVVVGSRSSAIPKPPGPG